MNSTGNGWVGVVEGSFELLRTGGGADMVEFSAEIAINNLTGQVSLLDLDLDE